MLARRSGHQPNTGSRTIARRSRSRPSARARRAVRTRAEAITRASQDEGPCPVSPLYPDEVVPLRPQHINDRARAEFAQRQHSAQRLPSAKEWLEKLGNYTRQNEKAILEIEPPYIACIELTHATHQPAYAEEELFHGTFLSTVPEILRLCEENGHGLIVSRENHADARSSDDKLYVSNLFECACRYPGPAWVGSRMHGESLMRDQRYPMLAIFGAWAAKENAVWSRKKKTNRQWAYEDGTFVTPFRLYLRPVPPEGCPGVS